jgi:starvation-inducible DNA-binding protein
MPAQTATLHKTHIDLDEDTRTTVVELLNRQLADTADLYSQTKQAHWNVKGPHFIALHELFDKLAADVQPFVDEIAERVTALGGTALGTTRMAAKASSLKEYPSDIFDGKEHVKALVERWASYAASTRAAIDKSDDAGDATTADLFTQISGTIDKDLWFLEAHIQS